MDHDYIQLPNGQKMPILGLGTSRATDPEECTKALNDALTAGYRLFDTAYNYGNESIIGEVLHSWLTSGKVKREELFIVTKLPSTGMDEALVEHFLKLSLTALQLDYVDLYLVHTPVGLRYVDDATNFPREEDGVKLALDLSTDHVKVWKAMEAQVEAGRAKAIGLSNFSIRQIERIVSSAKILPASIQGEAHIYFQQKALRETCAKHGITFCAYAPFGSPGRMVTYEKLGVTSFEESGILADPVLGSIAKAHGKKPAQVLLRFLIQSGIVVIPKSTNAGRILENRNVFDFILSPDEMKQFQDLDRGEAGKTFDFSTLPGILEHPEFPTET